MDHRLCERIRRHAFRWDENHLSHLAAYPAFLDGKDIESLSLVLWQCSKTSFACFKSLTVATVTRLWRTETSATTSNRVAVIHSSAPKMERNSVTSSAVSFVSSGLLGIFAGCIFFTKSSWFMLKPSFVRLYLHPQWSNGRVCLVTFLNFWSRVSCIESIHLGSAVSAMSSTCVVAIANKAPSFFQVKVFSSRCDGTPPVSRMKPCRHSCQANGASFNPYTGLVQSRPYSVNWWSGITKSLDRAARCRRTLRGGSRITTVRVGECTPIFFKVFWIWSKSKPLRNAPAISMLSTVRFLHLAAVLINNLWLSLVAVVDRVVNSPFCWSRKPLAHNLLLILMDLSGYLLRFLTQRASTTTISLVNWLLCNFLNAFSSTNCFTSARSAASTSGHISGVMSSSAMLHVSSSTL